MKKNIILIGVIVLNFIIMGFIIYQNNYINAKFEEIDKKLEYLSSSDNQQKIQIKQLMENQIKLKQQDALENLDTGTDELIFENTPTNGLKAITEDEAKKIWEEYLTNTLFINISSYNCSEIKKVMIRPTNSFTAGSTSTTRTADFERNAYLFKYKKNDNLEEVIGYVDIYTGKVIGGSYKGD